MQTKSRVVQLHSMQQQFRRSSALYRAFIGGRGSGKSWCGAYDLLRRAQPNRTYLVASPTYSVLEDTTLPTFIALAKELGVFRSLKKTPHPNVTLARNVTVRFRSSEDPDKMRGPNYSGAWLDEASLMSEDAYLIVIACLREAGQQGWLSATATPNGKLHWTYRVFGTGAADTALFHARTRDNPFNPPSFEETLRRQYPSDMVDQELGGLFIDPLGARFKAKWFKRYQDIGDAWRLMDTGEVLLKAWGACASVLDPASKPGAKSDYNALVTGAELSGHRLLITDVVRERIPLDKLARRVNETCYRMKPQWIGIEANGFQMGIVNDCRDRQRYPFIPSIMEMSHEGKSKLTRAIPAILRAEHGLVYLPESAPWLDDFVGELCQFTGDDKVDPFDDQADALSYLVIGFDSYHIGDGEAPFVAGRRRT